MKAKSIMFKVFLRTHVQGGIKVRRSVYRFLAVLLFTAVMPFSLAYAAPSVDEDFSGPTLNPNLEDPDGAYTIAGGTIHKTIFNNNSDRRYIRTVATDYNTVDFIAELTFTLTDLPGGNFAIHFFGLGPGSPYPAGFNEPTGVLFRIHSSDIVGGRVDAVARPAGGNFSGGTFNIGSILTSGGTHRARITKLGNQVDFAIDVDFNGAFVADINSQIADLAAVAPFLNGTNSRIYFGTASAVDVFDDLQITVTAPALDHFTFYKAKGDRVNVLVDLEDQFGSEPGVKVREPKLFGNPVAKTHEGNITRILNREAHLTCYKIKGDEEKRDVVVENQFGEQTLEVKKPELLCVPSEKISAVVVPDDDDDHDGDDDD